MTTNQQPDLDAIQTRLDALNALGIPIPGATWQASPRDEKSVIPPELAHVVEDVLKTGGALLRSSVGVFGDEAHAEFVAHAREDVEALVAEVRRLRAELAGRGTPVAGGVAAPSPSRAYLEMELKRNELDKGFTDQEWAVGGVVCPEGFSCVSHPLTVFRPTRQGRLPIHRHERFGDACPGSGQKPTTPPLQLKPAARSAAV